MRVRPGEPTLCVLELCCAARRRLNGECAANCVRFCAVSALEAGFSTRVEADVSFAKQCLYLDAISGYQFFYACCGEVVES